MAHTQQEFERLEMELFITRQYFMMAITCLPGKQLTISLSEEAQMGEQPFKLQAKFDEKRGQTHFRAVKA